MPTFMDRKAWQYNTHSTCYWHHSHQQVSVHSLPLNLRGIPWWAPPQRMPVMGPTTENGGNDAFVASKARWWKDAASAWISWDKCFGALSQHIDGPATPMVGRPCEKIMEREVLGSPTWGSAQQFASAQPRCPTWVLSPGAATKERGDEPPPPDPTQTADRWVK